MVFESWFYVFLLQVNNAAHERCQDPIPLEPPILDKLINAKLAKK
jgi:vacuolar protein sorting-associated protein 51